MNRVVSFIAPLGWLSSLAIHAAAGALLLQSAHGARMRRPPTSVTLSVVSVPRVHPAAPVLPVPTSAPATNKAPAPTSTRNPEKEPAHKVTPATPTPVDLTGVTLTGGEWAGWASMTGNGLAMDNPIRHAVAAAPQRPTPASNNTRKGSHPALAVVEVVSVNDLGAKPTPPSLNARLLANYPAVARQQGQAGSAQLLVRIDADGVVRQCTIQTESSAEFGAACRRTLLGSQWSAPHDRTGKAVVTQIYYTCDFRVSGS